MKEQKIAITINKSITDVFAFTIDPTNTPKWISAVILEKTNEWPVKVGTVYKSQDSSGTWRELVMTEYEENKTFVLSENNGFHIRYTFESLSENKTLLSFHIWTDHGDLKNYFTTEVLKKLKSTIEAS